MYLFDVLGTLVGILVETSDLVTRLFISVVKKMSEFARGLSYISLKCFASLIHFDAL